MKRILWAILIAGLVRFAFYEYHMQQSSTDVTDAQISTYLTNIGDGCKKATIGRGVEPEKANLACDCLVGSLKKDVTQSEWQRAYAFSRQGQDDQAEGILREPLEKAMFCKQNER